MTDSTAVALLRAASRDPNSGVRSSATHTFEQSGSAKRIPHFTSDNIDATGKTVVLLSLRIDDSGSMSDRMRGDGGAAEQAVVEAHNIALRVFRKKMEEQHRDDVVVLVTTSFFEGRTHNLFAPIADAKDLTRDIYNPCIGTPLYDTTVDDCATITAKMMQLTQAGAKEVRTASLLISDGEDGHSERCRAEECNAAITGLAPPRSKRPKHFFAAMGIGGSDFHSIFRQMGIDPKWILSTEEVGRLTDVLTEFVEVASQFATALPGTGTSDVLQIGFSGSDNKK